MHLLVFSFLHRMKVRLLVHSRLGMTMAARLSSGAMLRTRSFMRTLCAPQPLSLTQHISRAATYTRRILALIAASQGHDYDDSARG